MAGIRYCVIKLIFSTREYMDDHNLLDIEVRIPVRRVNERSGTIRSTLRLQGENERFIAYCKPRTGPVIQRPGPVIGSDIVFLRPTGSRE